ncbi:YceI family protein [Sphingomonas oryzagri]|uniref:YceI family protein n=1 Tax=Sphingomonas oryzagri TaxID=3042314 RepID=A0ABT6MXY0_9SPHN|nr:YceI family protein [Sphingomonas oryzagri]MDH7637865.1 YceI family protein [Sphingomonas oryzagri]
MRLLALAALLALSPATAQPPMKLPSAPPGKPDPAGIVAGTYAIEPSHTQVMFALDHLGFSIFRGFFSNVSGTLKLDPKNLGATRLEVSIPIDSIYTTSKELNDELIGTKFFDVQHWPNATFSSTSVLLGPDGKVLVNGNLTLHGQTHPVQMTVKLHGAGKSLMGKGQSLGFDARTAINRSEYGIGGGVPLVSDQVQITIAAAFEQQ